MVKRDGLRDTKDGCIHKPTTAVVASARSRQPTFQPEQGRVPQDPTLSWWLLEMEKSVFFRGVAPDRLFMHSR